MTKSQLKKRVQELEKKLAQQKAERRYDIIKVCRMNARYADDINTLNRIIIDFLGGCDEGLCEDDYVKPPMQ